MIYRIRIIAFCVPWQQQAEIALNNAFLIEALRQQLDEIRASREALAQTQHQLLRSREEERSRLARDLHDSPIQSLIGLNIQLGLLLNAKDLSACRGRISQGNALRSTPAFL